MGKHLQINSLNFRSGLLERFSTVITEVIPDRYFLKTIFLRLLICIYTPEYSINDLPGAFKDYFTKRSDTHDYSPGHVNDFNLTKNKKAFSDHAIRTRGPVPWILLSKSLKDSKSVKHFRKQLKQNLSYFMNNQLF